jgi:SOS-response transcriptional repressor LexA
MPILMAVENERLRAIRLARGYVTATDAARAMGMPAPTYISHENGIKGIPPKAARRYATFFGVDFNAIYGGTRATSPQQSVRPLPVVRNLTTIGVVQAGVWHEERDAGEMESVPVAADPKYGASTQFVLRVEGDSMDRAFPPGSYAHCVRWSDLGRDPKDGDLVVVERRRAGLFEQSLKRVRMVDGAVTFEPESHSPRHKALNTSCADGEEIAIIALVIGKYQPF